MMGGFLFPAGNSPRPEMLTAGPNANRQPLSALEVSRRRRNGLVDPDDPSFLDELLPPVAGLNLQAHAGWYDGTTSKLAPSLLPPDAPPLRTALAADDCSLPPPQRPSSRMGDLSPTGTPVRPASGASPPADNASFGADGTARSWQSVGADRPRSRGVADFPAVEAVNEAVDERTALLTRIFQDRLAKQLATLQGIRDAEAKAHEREVRMP